MVYVTVIVPAIIPVTMPVPVPTVATGVVVELHEPPGVASVRVMDCSTQTVAAPMMGAGPAVMVSVRVAAQPVGNV